MLTQFPHIAPIARARGHRIGILGGSFDPPHAGHLLVAKRALSHLGLDHLIWVPSLQNPLKERAVVPMGDRLKALEDFTRHPDMQIRNWEAAIGSPYTIDLIRASRQSYPRAGFVLIMGSDALAGLHRWRGWETLAHLVAICAFARPGEQLPLAASPFARRFAKRRVAAKSAAMLPNLSPPCWSLIPGPMVDISSSEIRESG